MLKRSMVIGLLAMLTIAGFTACKTGLDAPVGSKGDYTEIPAKDCDLTIAPGSGYYCEVPLPHSQFYTGDTQIRFVFNATGNTTIHYAEKLHSGTYSEVWAVHIEKDSNGDEVDRHMDPRKSYGKNDFDDTLECKTDDFYAVEINLRQYDPDGGTAAEFYIWAE